MILIKLNLYLCHDDNLEKCYYILCAIKFHNPHI